MDGHTAARLKNIQDTLDKGLALSDEDVDFLHSDYDPTTEPPKKKEENDGSSSPDDK